MAYADGELHGNAKAEFEARLAQDPALGREVAELQALHLVARAQAPLEPADHEWRRLDADPLQRTGLGLGWTLLIVAGLLLGALSVISIARDESTPLGVRILMVAGILGAGLLLGMTLRERLRILPFDPYNKVQR